MRGQGRGHEGQVRARGNERGTAAVHARRSRGAHRQAPAPRLPSLHQQGPPRGSLRHALKRSVVRSSSQQPHLGVRHAGHAAVTADVSGHALQSHDRHGARLLGDARLLGGHHIHDHAACRAVWQARSVGRGGGGERADGGRCDAGRCGAECSHQPPWRLATARCLPDSLTAQQALQGSGAHP